MERYSSLADDRVTLDEDLVVDAPTRNEWWNKYKHNRYDWDDDGWKRQNRGKLAWAPVKLNHGFFSIVPLARFEEMTVSPDGSPRKFRINLKYDDEGNVIGAYAVRSGLRRLKEPDTVGMHRELMVEG